MAEPVVKRRKLHNVDEITFVSADLRHHTKLQAPDTVNDDHSVALTFPNRDPHVEGALLTANPDGQMDWLAHDDLKIADPLVLNDITAQVSLTTPLIDTPADLEIQRQTVPQVIFGGTGIVAQTNVNMNDRILYGSTAIDGKLFLRGSSAAGTAEAVNVGTKLEVTDTLTGGDIVATNSLQSDGKLQAGAPIHGTGTLTLESDDGLPNLELNTTETKSLQALNMNSNYIFGDSKTNGVLRMRGSQAGGATERVLVECDLQSLTQISCIEIKALNTLLAEGKVDVVGPIHGRGTLAIQSADGIDGLELSATEITSRQPIQMRANTIYGDIGGGGILNLDSTPDASKGYIRNRSKTLIDGPLWIHNDILPFGVLALGNFYRMLQSSGVVSSIETSLFEDISAVGSRTMPANSLIAGSTFRVTLGGIATTAVPTALTLRAKLNGSTIVTNTETFNVATNTSWTFEVVYTIRTIGAGGTAIGTGMLIFDDNGSAACMSMGVTGTIAIDTTVANTVDMTGQWALGTASMICQTACISSS